MRSISGAGTVDIPFGKSCVEFHSPAGQQGRIGAADDNPSECTGNEVIQETTMEESLNDLSCIIDRTYTVGTVGKEASSMALIVQRAPQAVVKLKDRAQSLETVPSDIPTGQLNMKQKDSS
ncbi:hypothetical protein ACHAW6_010258 [Cyclotella cf. meneghiniana]